MSEPLKGIKVIDLSCLLPGGYCSLILAYYGADVICIEDRRCEPEPCFDMVYCKRGTWYRTLRQMKERRSFLFQLKKQMSW